jgi:hypothetical protein
VTGVMPFSRRLHAGLRVMTIGLPLLVAGLLVTLFYIWCSYGNPRPDNWFRLELASTIIGDSLLLVAAQVFGGYMKGMQHVRDCEAVIIMCFDSDGQAGLA